MMNIVAKETCIMTPTNDYLFKRIFGQLGNEEITKGLVSSIIGRKIKDISLEGNTILAKDLVTDKLGILDVKIRFDTNVVCDVEMQLENQKDLDKRILYYWSKMYSNEIKEGEKYKILKKAIIIVIAKFEMKEFKEIPKFHTEWLIREKYYKKTILTDALEIHIIELPKLEKMVKQGIISKEDKKLALWSKFLLNPYSMEEEEMRENKDIKKAKEELDKINKDEYERRLAELRQKAIRDDAAIRDFLYEEGLEKGIEKGIKDGKKQGTKETKKKIAKRMLESGIQIEEVIKITELSRCEIEEI